MADNITAWARTQQVGNIALKATLIEIANWANPDGGDCFPSVPRLAKALEVSERSVQRYIDALERLGLIRRVERYRATNNGQTSNGFEFPAFAGSGDARPPVTSCHRGGASRVTPMTNHFTKERKKERKPATEPANDVRVEASQDAIGGSGSNASASSPGDRRVVKLRTILLERHGEKTFRSWFERLDWHIDEHNLTVTAQSPFVMDHVRNYMLGKVYDAARSAIGRDVEIMFAAKQRAA